MPATDDPRDRPAGSLRSGDTALRVRLLLAAVCLSAVVVGFVFAVHRLFVAVVSVLGIDPVVAGVVTALLFGVGALAELRAEQVIRAESDAVVVSAEEYPALLARVERLSAQFDLPTPTVAVAERAVPTALVAGLTRSRATLILSTGLLDALDDAELDAVVAHELAHLRNADALLLTATSLPTLIAGRIRRRIESATALPSTGLLHRSAVGVLLVPLYVVAAGFWVVGRVLGARVSRVRELTADDGAVAATGDPAALAGALRTLDDRLRDTPRADLRAATGPLSLSVVGVDDHPPEPVGLGPDGDRRPLGYRLRYRLAPARRWLFGSHPPLDRRLARLRRWSRELNRDG